MPVKKTFAAVLKTWAIRLVLVAIPAGLAIYFPKTLGALVTVLFALLLALWLVWRWVKRKLKVAFKAIGSNIAELSAFSQVLELVPSPEGQPDENETVEEVIKTLESLGFTARAAYVTKGAELLRVVALVHPEAHSFAVVYCGTGNVEYIAKFGDNAYLSYTNAEGGRMRADSPDTPVVLKKELDAAALFSAFSDHALAGPKTAVTAANFTAFYRAFQEEHKARNQAAAEAAEAQAKAFHDAFIAQSGWTEKQWERDGERVLFIHDEIDASSLVNYYIALADWDNEMEDHTYELHEKMAREKAESMGARAAFAALIDAGNLGDRAEKLFELSEPLPTDVYLQPALDFDGGDDDEEEDDDE